MDNRLSEAARTGNTGMLRQLLEENPFIINDFMLMSSYENPLSTAAKAGQAVFVKEIVKLEPQLAKVVDRNGFRPLDIASACGNMEIVRELLVAGPEICRLPGRDGRTAIHYAAVNGRIEVLDALISACDEAVKDVTSFGETVLHLAVKYFKIEAFRHLMQCLEKLGMEEELLNWGDKEGNTVLHYAVSRKQLETVDSLLSNSNIIKRKLEVNVQNNRGLTAVDVLDIVIESSSDIHLKELLRQAGGSRGAIHAVSAPLPSIQQPDANSKTTEQTHHLEKRPKDWLKRFQFQWHRDSLSETRNALLVVAALLATVTFQAGVNPPSFFLEEQSIGTRTTTTTLSPPSASTIPPSPQPELQYHSGRLVPLTVFLVANSIGLSAAVNIIDYLMAGFPFQRELQVSMFSIMFAYGWSAANTEPSSITKEILIAVSMSLPLLLRWGPALAKEICKRIFRRKSMAMGQDTQEAVANQAV